MLTFLFPAVDCEVSPWSSWSGCSERCGEGYSERRRYVLTENQNAGAKCPKLREFRGCKDYRGCEVEDAPGNSVAMILPYKYSQSRTGPQWEHPKARAPRFDNYCVHFKFKRFHPTCETPGIINWTTSLKKGSKACVECSRPAYGSSGICSGEGIQKQKTRWAAVDIQGCRGVWQRTSIVKDCKCGEENENRFIFV
ncbi:putative somatomedin-B and thrombospondin type-1 domain-containing protein [Apostichopus japonicus]|uniref:Putative somatomedin-B and thrombospondin type-1 domain-containing protein n=1 Tax=Stichopus japonicus TaxID=307972 RepID=A0A2G8KN06_STIJA|nr:putative somatomedin-B and thrombospondin type-1 domain-containing protein [Apostichopus japonicus]